MHESLKEQHENGSFPRTTIVENNDNNSIKQRNKFSSLRQAQTVPFGL